MLLIGALVVAVTTALMARSMLGADPAASPVPRMPVAAPAQPVGPEVLVATRPLAVGTILSADSIRYQPWPQELIGNAYFLRGKGVDTAKLIGAVVRTEITAGQPLTQGALVQPGDRGFLAAALGPGMRAVSVPVSTNTGVAGFVFPGDRIDLVLTQDVSGEGPPLKVSETIIRNLRVLATDQRTDKPAKDEEGRTAARTFSTITVEATPKIAEKIAVAQTMGTLSLSLRSLADNSSELERAIAAGEVELPDGADAKAEKQMMLAVAALPQDRDTTFTVGADVSRFQRGSVPTRPGSAPPGPMGGYRPPVEAAASSGVRVARGSVVSEAVAASPSRGVPPSIPLSRSN
nr:Flp pilus assembly protein CpaB [Sphingomonas quercus]